MEEEEIDFFFFKKKQTRLHVLYPWELKFWEMEKGLRLFDLFAKLLSYSKSVHIDFFFLRVS